MNHGDKKAIIQTRFSLMLKKGTSRTTDLNWEHILESDCDLSDLDGDFMEGEVKGAIFGSSTDKTMGLTVSSRRSTKHVGTLLSRRSCKLSTIFMIFMLPTFIGSIPPKFS
jgi:hypothetical protein